MNQQPPYVPMTKHILIPLILVLTLGGCASTFTEKLANNLNTVILNHDDPETVRQGLPAYMLMLDTALLDNPGDPHLLLASASLNNAYASLFSKHPEQTIALANKAKAQSRTALCQQVSAICNQQDANLQTFKSTLASIDKDNIEYLYTYGATLATWIQIHKNNWEAIIQVPRVTAIMERIIELNETYEWGRGHLFLGIIHSQLPAALGGKPEVGLNHFKKAIEISDEQDLIAKVELARNYARLIFDQALHDKMLNEVIESDVYADKLTLSNVLAKQAARELLATSAEYFED